MTDTTAEWPFSLNDPTRAVHFALEPDCPYNRPESCPREAEAQQTIGAYLTWLSAHAAEPPHQPGPVAPHGPHSPSGAPEGPATQDRAADGRTAPPWSDGDPLMLAIATAIWERCRTEGTSLVVDDPRTIAAVAAHVIRTTPDSRTDSPDSGQDSTPDTETDSRATSADTVRTARDTGPCDQHPGAPVIGGTCGACTIHPDGPAAERYEWRQRALRAEATIERMKRTNRMVNGGARQERERAEQAEATIKRVRRLANDWAILRTHGSAAYELRAALDEPAAEQSSVVHSGTKQQASEVQQVDEPRPAEAERDQAYRERAHLLAWLAALHPANAVITPADDVDEPGWQLLYLLVGGWQMSWHIHPRDSELFTHVEHVTTDDPRAQGDGHSTTAKYDRLQQHVRRIAADRP